MSFQRIGGNSLYFGFRRWTLASALNACPAKKEYRGVGEMKTCRFRKLGWKAEELALSGPGQRQFRRSSQQ